MSCVYWPLHENTAKTSDIRPYHRMDDILTELHKPPFSNTVCRELRALLLERNADLDAVATAGLQAIRTLPAFTKLTTGQLLAEEVAVRLRVPPVVTTPLCVQEHASRHFGPVPRSSSAMVGL